MEKQPETREEDNGACPKQSIDAGSSSNLLIYDKSHKAHSQWAMLCYCPLLRRFTYVLMARFMKQYIIHREVGIKKRKRVDVTLVLQSVVVSSGFRAALPLRR